MYNVTHTYIHTMTKRILDHTTESTPETRQYQIIQYTSMAISTFGMFVSKKEYILIGKNAAIMCGMYIINGVHRPEPRSSGGNTSSNPQVSAPIPRPVFNGMERMCQRHGSNKNSHPPVLVRKPLCNQFIHYHISSRRDFGINHFKLRNFAVVAIECSFATVDRGSIMARIHRWSVMIYGSLQTEFMETMYNSHIHGYGTSVFGKIVLNISKSIKQQ